MHGLCTSCGAPSCMVVSARPTDVDPSRTATALSDFASHPSQPPLTRFCVFCGAQLPMVTTTTKTAALNKHTEEHVTEFDEDPSSTLILSKDAAAAGQAVVPLSTLRAVVQALAREHEEEVARLCQWRAAPRQSPAAGDSVSSSMAPHNTTSSNPASSGLQHNSSAVLLSSSHVNVTRSAKAAPGQPVSTATAPAPPPSRLTSRAARSDGGTQRSGTTAINAQGHTENYRVPHHRGENNAVHRNCVTNKISSCGKTTDVRAASEIGNALSRTRSPSIVIPRETAEAAPVTAGAPPRCSHTLPRHSCSYDSALEVPVEVAATNTTSAHRGRRSWSLLEDEGGMSAESGAAVVQRSSWRAGVDVEEAAQNAAQQEAYERLRDALLQQL